MPLYDWGSQAVTPWVSYIGNDTYRVNENLPEVEVHPDSKKSHAYNNRYSKNPLRRAFEKYVEFPLSQYLMSAIHQSQHAENPIISFLGNLRNNKEYYYKQKSPLWRDVAQDTYLMSRDGQRRKFYQAGYIDGDPSDYGLVRKATLDLNSRRNDSIPVFQRAPDAVDRDQLDVIGNIQLGDVIAEHSLEHSGNSPAALYADPLTGNLYVKGWDLNDYGPSNGGAAKTYSTKAQELATQLDMIGSPVVVTTGIQPILNYKHDPMTIYNYQDKDFYLTIPERNMISKYLGKDTIPILPPHNIRELLKKKK